MKILILLLSSVGVIMGNQVALQEFTTGNNMFTAAIYREVQKDFPENFIISPFSIQTVLAVTQSGAKEDTASEIRSSLRLPDSSEKTEALYSTILPTLKGNDKYSLHSANKIYVKNNYSLNENFKKVATNVYKSGIENIDFSQKDAAADTINEWVEEQTNHKIRDLIDKKNLNDDTRLILVNALYFKGKWVNAFETYSTNKVDFYVTAKNVIKVGTMHITDDFNYYESPELKAKFLEMPYEGDDVSMVIVLPNEKEGLSALENQIEKIFTAPNFTKERVAVSLPRFTVDNKIQLKKMLENMGLKKAFTDDADLSGIAGKKGELRISDVVQKAFINVTEDGTEAAAATAVEFSVESSSAEEEEPKEFDADHPYMFYIKIKHVIIFGGRIRTPKTV